MNLSRRDWLRSASGLFLAAPIAHRVFAPKFGAWFRQLFRPSILPKVYGAMELPSWPPIRMEYLSLEELQRRYNAELSGIIDRVRGGEIIWGISYSTFPRVSQ